VQDAERRASSIADSSEGRHRALLVNIAASEGRLRDLANSLRGLASSLDDAVGAGEVAEPVDEAMRREQDAARLEESLRVEGAESEKVVPQFENRR
jgi:hypothetical protein